MYKLIVTIVVAQLFFAGAVYSFGEPLAITPCAGKPAPTSVRVKGCDAVPCNFVIGQDGVSQVTFDVPANTTQVKIEVRAKAFGIWITYDLPQAILDDTCGKTILSGPCPLVQGTEALFQLGLPTDSPFVVKNVLMQFTLFGDNNQVLFCYSMNTNVVRG